MRIVVTGLIAQHPQLGGLAWHYLQYVVGLARLGHDVYYLEDSGEWPYTLDGGPSGDEWIARDCRCNIEHLHRTLDRFGLGDRWAYRFPADDPRWFGLPDLKRNEVVRTADLMLNVSGSLEYPSRYRHRVRRMAYVDTDPVFTQIKIAKGDMLFCPRVVAHDVHFTFGETIDVAAGYTWLPTRQPVLLPEWRSEEPTGDTFATVMSWTSYEPLMHAGRAYGQKDVEFLRFLDLPARVAPWRLQVALSNIDHRDWMTDGIELPAAVRERIAQQPDMTPRQLLTSCGWSIADAMHQCGDVDGYQTYIRSSLAEWSIAKHGYVVERCGWFSDRSACYLAAGRPVVVQNTGFDVALPVGEGLIAFDTIEEAAEGVRSVAAEPHRHSRAARAIAEAFFDSSNVLSSLVERSLTAAPPSTPGLRTV